MLTNQKLSIVIGHMTNISHSHFKHFDSSHDLCLPIEV